MNTFSLPKTLDPVRDCVARANDASDALIRRSLPSYPRGRTELDVAARAAMEKMAQMGAFGSLGPTDGHGMKWGNAAWVCANACTFFSIGSALFNPTYQPHLKVSASWNSPPSAHSFELANEDFVNRFNCMLWSEADTATPMPTPIPEPDLDMAASVLDDMEALYQNGIGDSRAAIVDGIYANKRALAGVKSQKQVALSGDMRAIKLPAPLAAAGWRLRAGGILQKAILGDVFILERLDASRKFTQPELATMTAFVTDFLGRAQEAERSADPEGEPVMVVKIGDEPCFDTTAPNFIQVWKSVTAELSEVAAASDLSVIAQDDTLLDTVVEAEGAGQGDSYGTW